VKRYNLADRQQVSKARRAAVLHLRSRGFTFKTIGYALGVGVERTRQLYSSALRRWKADTKIKQAAEAVSSATIARFTVPKLTQNTPLKI
jgi:hypothetical protein